MTQEEKEKQLISLDKAIQNMKDNQRLIMGVLTDIDSGLKNEDLKVVKWAYTRRLKMLQHEKHIIHSKKTVKH
jgi:UDP-glucose 6-dehydrogenase